MVVNEPTVSVPSVDVLLNRGFRTIVHKVTQDPTTGKWNRDVDHNDVPEVFEVTHIRIDNWITACIEDEFGGMEEWQEQFEKKTFHTLSKTLAIIEGHFKTGPNGTTVPDTEYGAKRMKDGAVTDYSIAMTNGMMLAQGVSPELVGEAVAKAFRDMKKEQQKAEDQMREDMSKDDDKTPPPPNVDADIPTNPSNSLVSESTSLTG